MSQHHHDNPYFHQRQAESEADLLRVHSPRPSRIASDFEHFRPNALTSYHNRNKSASSLNNTDASENVTSQTRLVDSDEKFGDSNLDRQRTLGSVKSFATLSHHDTNVTDRSINDKHDDPGRGLLPPSMATRSRWSCSGLAIIFLALFSTIFSMMFFLIAVCKPRYGYRIHATGHLTPTSASLMSAIFAKSIEISFVTVFVTFLGQVLSRRALNTNSKGINLSEILMRTWPTSPGSMLTSISLRYAGPKFLGILSICVTLFATLYTTAADSLVSPKLKWGTLGAQDIRGMVTSNYANSTTLVNNCPAIVSADQDGPVNGGALPVSQITCYNIHNSFPSLRDFTTYSNLFKAWSASENSTTSNVNVTVRPNASTVYKRNTYYGQFTSIQGENGINNVSLVMPHGGLVPAIQNGTENHFVQPDMSGDFGNIDVTASIINPAVNVLCASLDDETVQWFIRVGGPYDTNRTGRLDPSIQKLFNFSPNASVTGWYDYTYNINKLGHNGTGYEAPRFEKDPIEYNSVLWQTFAYSDGAMYVLVRANGTEPKAYSMCSVRSYLTTECSTRYVSASGGGNVTIDCSPNNPLAASRLLDAETMPKYEYMNQFKDIATELGYALNLNTGATNSNNSLSRVLGYFALASNTSSLSNALPSLAEALAVLYSNTLVSASDGAQLVPMTSTSKLPFWQPFRAHVKTQEYASGTSSGYQLLFYVILTGVFLVNFFCLTYFLLTPNLVTDWTDSANLFCVSLVSSPPESAKEMMVVGNIVAQGVESKEQFSTGWHIKHDGRRVTLSHVGRQHDEP